MKKFILALFLLCVLPSIADATVWHVKASGGSTGSCSTAIGASDPGIYLRTINAALNCIGTATGAGAGHTVRVYANAAGTSTTFAERSNNNMPGGSSWSSPFTFEVNPGDTVVIRPPDCTGNVAPIRFARNAQKFIYVRGSTTWDPRISTTGGRLILDGAGCTTTTMDGLRFASDSAGGAPTDIRVEGVEIRNATNHGVLSAGSNARLELRRLWVHDNGSSLNIDDTHGLYLHGPDNLIEDSLIERSWHRNIQIRASTKTAHRAKIRRNLIRDGGRVPGGSANVVLAAGDDIEFYNNIVAGGTTYGVSATCSGGCTARLKIYNNTIVGHSSHAVRMASAESGTVDTEIRNNIFWQNGGNVDVGPSTGTIQSHNSTANPNFVNQAGGDYRLQASSTAQIDLGITLSIVTTDYTGAQRVGLYDIGAYEFGGTVAQPVITVYSAFPQAISSGQLSTITWATTSATACTASGTWAGSRATSGSESVGATGQYTLTCTGPGGSTNQSLTITSATAILKLPSKPSSLRLGALSGPIKIGAGGDTPDQPSNATDAFARANGALGTNWDVGYSGFTSGEIVNERVRQISLGLNLIATWTGANIGPEQSAEVKFRTLTPGTGTREGGVLLRASAPPTLTAYYVVGSTNAAQTTRIFKITAGSSALVASNATQTWAAGDTIKATAVGSTISVFRNGGANPVLTFTDPTPIASGRPGIAGFVSASASLDAMEIDDFNLVELAPPQVSFPCHRYAAPFPTGNGSGLSQANAYTIASFWQEVSSAVRNLCLLDGTYTGTASIIDPPSGLNGTSGSPIRIMAVNDGGPWLNGQGARRPVLLSDNDWFVLEGFDASDSNISVISVGAGAENNIIRRVCAWNSSASSNDRVWAFTGDQASGLLHNNLIEDGCGFGTSRRIFAFDAGGGGNTLRRFWAAYTTTSVGGPESAYQFAYESEKNTLENVIGTWKQLTDADSVGAVRAVVHFANEGQNHKLLGSLFYVRAGDMFEPTNLLTTDWAVVPHGPIEIKDTIFYTEQASKRPLNLQSGGSPCTSCALTNITEIGGIASSIGSAWSITNRGDYDTVSAMNSANANPFQSTTGTGARMCFRYVDGTLNTTKLWPWPMDQRIRQALTRSGRNPDTYFGGAGRTVTDLVESIFGTIPAACRN